MTERDDPPLSTRLELDVDDLLRPLVEGPVPPLPDDEARVLRARIVSAIDAHQASRVGRRTERHRWLAGFGAAAAAAAVALVVWAGARRWHPTAAVAHTSVVALAGTSELVGIDGTRTVEGTGGSVAGPDDELETGPEASARADLPTGAVVQIGPSARVRFVPIADARAIRDRIELAAGKIDVRVPKLGAGSELRVHTPSATIVVHGTRFSVERRSADAADGPGTRVLVSEGRVAVYANGEERFLGAGDGWTIADASPVPTKTAAIEPPAPDGPSTLAIENGLLAEAMSLRRAHQGERALALLDELLERYPETPLDETALVERLRALEDLGAMHRLARDAEAYLARYPRGFGRGEASRMLAEARARER